MKHFIILLFAILFNSISFAQTSASDYIKESKKLINENKYTEAISHLSDGIKQMPDSANLYNHRGLIYDAMREYKNAILDYNTGLKKATDSIEVTGLLINIGSSKYCIRDFKGAHKNLMRAFAIDSTNIKVLNNLSIVCDEIGKPEETLLYLEKIIQIDSTFVPAYINLGFAYQVSNEHEKALTYFDKAIELDPTEARSYSNRSFSKLKTGDTKGALKDINKSIKMFSSNSWAYKIRALIYIEKGKTEDACDDLTTASRLGYTKQYGDEVNDLIRKHCK